MPRSISKDKSIDRVNAAAAKVSAKGGGTAGGSLMPLEFTPGVNELYSPNFSSKVNRGPNASSKSRLE